jgi:hypothetical protein
MLNAHVSELPSARNLLGLKSPHSGQPLQPENIYTMDEGTLKTLIP